MPGNHLLGVDGLGDAEPVLCTDAEAVLFALSQFGHPEAGLGAGAGDGHPVSLADVALLHDVVGDIAASVLLRGVPEERAGVDVQFGDLQRTFRRSRDVWREGEDTLLHRQGLKRHHCRLQQLVKTDLPFKRRLNC